MEDKPKLIIVGNPFQGAMQEYLASKLADKIDVIIVEPNQPHGKTINEIMQENSETLKIIDHFSKLRPPIVEPIIIEFQSKFINPKPKKRGRK